MKRMIIIIIAIVLIFSACGSTFAMKEIYSGMDEIPDCYELNRGIFGDKTGRMCKCGNLIAYSRYTYEHQKYTKKRTDGLYIRNENSRKSCKIADGIINNIAIREDGIYYLKLHEKGEIFIYNYDLYRFSFETRRNELIIKDCTFAQFSEEAVFYTQHYMSDKDFYREYKKPLDLKYEGKLVRHNLATGEESVIAEIPGHIYYFLVTSNSIFFSGEEGNPFDGGKNIYMCDHDGGSLRKLSDNDSGSIQILYEDEKTSTILCYNMHRSSDEKQKGSYYSLFNYNTKEEIWTYYSKDLPAGTYGLPAVYDGNLYFRMDGEAGLTNRLLRISFSEQRETSIIQAQDVCVSLYVFGDKLYGKSGEDKLMEVIP